MSKSVSHAESTREPYIIPRATGPRGDIGRELIRHVIHILTCNVHYHPSLRLYLPVGSISKTRIKVRVS